jgi:hypothetical protein
LIRRGLFYLFAFDFFARSWLEGLSLLFFYGLIGLIVGGRFLGLVLLFSVFFFKFVKKFLGVGADLCPRTSFDVFLNSSPIFPELKQTLHKLEVFFF